MRTLHTIGFRVSFSVPSSLFFTSELGLVFRLSIADLQLVLEMFGNSGSGFKGFRALTLMPLTSTPFKLA